jgi:hypothetical protein
VLPQPQPLSQPELQPQPRLKKLILGRDNFFEPQPLSQPQSFLLNRLNRCLPHESQLLQSLCETVSQPHELQSFLPNRLKLKNFFFPQESPQGSHVFAYEMGCEQLSQPPQCFFEKKPPLKNEDFPCEPQVWRSRAIAS